jgi:hypothetical protein
MAESEDINFVSGFVLRVNADALGLDKPVSPLAGSAGWSGAVARGRLPP